MSEEKNHISSYTSSIWVLTALLLLTVATVSITSVNLGPLSVSIAMFIAGLKATLVLLYFMHLKFDHKIFRLMMTIVLGLFLAIIVLTFLDYSFRIK